MGDFNHMKAVARAESRRCGHNACIFHHAGRCFCVRPPVKMGGYEAAKPTKKEASKPKAKQPKRKEIPCEELLAAMRGTPSKVGFFGSTWYVGDDIARKSVVIEAILQEPELVLPHVMNADLACEVLRRKAGLFDFLQEHLQESQRVFWAALDGDAGLRAEWLKTAPRREVHECRRWQWEEEADGLCSSVCRSKGKVGKRSAAQRRR